MVTRSKPLKTLGVLGGMGPAATAEFLRILAEGAPAESDQEHPRILMISDPAIPDRTRAILEKGEDPTSAMHAHLDRLFEWGVDLLAVPCNTAHYFIDLFRDSLKIPLVHIVEATLDSAKRTGPEGAWLLATSGTRQSGLYPAYARRMGYRFVEPSDARQKIIQESLMLVKAGKREEAGALLRRVVEELWDEQDIPLVTACTELPLAYAASGLPKDREISSLQALSDACLKLLYE